MNFSKTALTFQHLDRPSNFSIIKRLLNLAIFIGVAVLCVNLWLTHNQQAETWYKQQASQLGTSLAKLSAQTLMNGIINNDTSFIAQQLSHLANDPHINGVALYDQKGQLIEEQDNNVTLVARYQVDSTVPLVFIQDIRNSQGEIIGYLRIVLDETKVMQYHFDYQQQLFMQLEVLLVLAALLGFIICRAFYIFRYRQYRKPLPSQNT